MNKKVSTLTLLLVLTSTDFAHCLIRAPHKIEDKNTTTITPSPQSSGQSGNLNKVKEDATVPRLRSSVVQDWSSVCEQLCGASLGGPGCGGPQCSSSEEKQTSDKIRIGESLMGSHANQICPNLCKHLLGGSICNCTATRITRATIRMDRNTICTSFCEHSHITLSGCSPCQTEDPANDLSNITNPRDEHGYVFNITTTTPSTTPNWDQICANLCKNGNGGALCNCDLPPFL